MSTKATVGAILFSVLVLLPGSAPALQDAAQHLQRGVELLDNNQVEAAIAELERAVSLQPGNPRVRYYMGRALYAAGRYENAIEHLTIGLPVAADPSAFGLLLGQSLIELDRLTAARAALDVAAASRPGYPPIERELARICYRAGNVAAALEKFAQTAEIAPRWTVPRLQAAAVAAEAGDTELAAELFRAALDIDPAQPLVWIRLGDTLEAHLDYEGAVRAYETAIETAPELMQARLSLAYLLFNRQQFDAAASVLADLRESLPDDPQILLPIAEIQMIRGEHEAALDNIEAVLRVIGTAAATTPGAGQTNSPPRPLLLRTRELRAKTLMSLNRLADAETAARELLADDPSNLDGLFVLGTALVRGGNPQGREHLTTFQQLSDAREHRELAYEYYVRGNDPVRAATEFERALAIDPDDAGALTGLATARLAQGDAGAAIELLERARAAGAGSLAWYREWVLALHAAGRAAEATATWRQVRAAGAILGPRVWAALGQHEGAC